MVPSAAAVNADGIAATPPRSRGVQLVRPHRQVHAADGGLHETIRFANGAAIDSSDYVFV